LDGLGPGGAELLAADGAASSKRGKSVSGENVCRGLETGTGRAFVIQGEMGNREQR
jgi:hypothetical protein